MQWWTYCLRGKSFNLPLPSHRSLSLHSHELAALEDSSRDECQMKVNGQKWIKIAVQDEFSTIEFVIRRNYKAHDNRGHNHMENTRNDDEEKGERRQKNETFAEENFLAHYDNVEQIFWAHSSKHWKAFIPLLHYDTFIPSYQLWWRWCWIMLSWQQKNYILNKWKYVSWNPKHEMWTQRIRGG